MRRESMEREAGVHGTGCRSPWNFMRERPSKLLQLLSHKLLRHTRIDRSMMEHAVICGRWAIPIAKQRNVQANRKPRAKAAVPATASGHPVHQHNWRIASIHHITPMLSDREVLEGVHAALRFPLGGFSPSIRPGSSKSRALGISLCTICTISLLFLSALVSMVLSH